MHLTNITTGKPAVNICLSLLGRAFFSGVRAFGHDGCGPALQQKYNWYTFRRPGFLRASSELWYSNLSCLILSLFSIDDLRLGRLAMMFAGRLINNHETGITIPNEHKITPTIFPRKRILSRERRLRHWHRRVRGRRNLVTDRCWENSERPSSQEQNSVIAGARRTWKP